MSLAPTVEVENLTKRYSRHLALNDISFQIPAGEIVGLLGPNGAGKSTTLRILTTFQSGTSGTVRIGGHDVFYEPHQVRKIIGYLPDRNPLPDEWQVEDYLAFRAKLKRLPANRRKRLATILEQCGITEIRRRRIGKLSRGYLQRVGLADALIHDPALIILDEPTIGLDPNQMRSLRKLIRSFAPEKTVLLSTHTLSEITALCHRVIILDRGKILADESTESLLRRVTDFSEIRAELAGPAERIRQELQELAQEAEVTVQSLDEPFCRFVVRAPRTSDLRLPIARLASRNEWPLRELHLRENSLEEVFSRLTESHLPQ